MQSASALQIGEPLRARIAGAIGCGFRGCHTVVGHVGLPARYWERGPGDLVSSAPRAGDGMHIGTLAPVFSSAPGTDDVHRLSRRAARQWAEVKAVGVRFSQFVYLPRHGEKRAWGKYGDEVGCRFRFRCPACARIDLVKIPSACLVDNCAVCGSRSTVRVVRNEVMRHTYSAFPSGAAQRIEQ